jgi:hypothetical protein
MENNQNSSKKFINLRNKAINNFTGKTKDKHNF